MFDVNVFTWAPVEDYWLVQIVQYIIALIGVVLFALAYFRLIHTVTEANRRKFESTLYSLLSKILNHPEKKEQYLKRMDKLVKKHWQKEILLDQLINICYSFKGVYADRGREVFDHYKFLKRSKRKLKSLRWNKVVEGIIELSIIAEKDGRREIFKLINDPHPEVRKEARIAIVEIDRIQGLIDMNGVLGKMSRWTYISIFSVLQRSPFKLSTKDFNALSKSKNPSMRKLVRELEPYAVAD
ncbi:MAG: hypothetical protein JJ895_14580 [Balneolaceae bacterium]|nr:hypothetical protein [Balneolaceae bacterium]